MAQAGERQTQFLVYTSARKLARASGVMSPSGWQTFARKYNKEKSKHLPAKPDEAYAEKWEGWPEFLGTAQRVGRPKAHWPYAKAAQHVQALNFKGKHDFMEYARSAACPAEIPVTPHYVYKGKGWNGYAEFLGNPIRGVAASRQYWPYKEAQAYVQNLGLTSSTDWAQWRKSSKRPPQIPANPHLAYKGKGWTNWGDFLGAAYQKAARMTGLRRPLKVLSYRKAREVVSELGFKTAQDFRIWARSGQRPESIPVHPDVTYQGKTWKGWGHFLGKEVSTRGDGWRSTRSVLSYQAGQTVVKGLGLKSAQDYIDLLKTGDLPNGLPADPATYYSKSGWKSWSAFLGARQAAAPVRSLKTRPDGLLKFADARRFAIGLRLPNTAAWFRYASSRRRPVYVPKEPWKAYFQDGYTSLEHFLGLPEPAEG